MSGQRVFVTGGASGLGLAVALRYARAGARVCIGDINEDRGRHAEKMLRDLSPDSFYRRCDVTRELDLHTVADLLVERWGGVDVVVNNAGVAQAGPIEDVTLANWEWIVNINLLGVVRGCRVFTPVFKKQGSGRFINIASMAGLMDIPMMSSYNATKAAVVSLSETLQNELADAGIKVMVVCPAFFKTNLNESLRTSKANLASFAERLMEKSRLSAEDVAECIFRAAAADGFYVLPHREALVAWLLKRFLPRTWFNALRKKQMTRYLRRVEAEA